MRSSVVPSSRESARLLSQNLEIQSKSSLAARQVRDMLRRKSKTIECGRRLHFGGDASCSASCATYTIVNILWNRTQRDFSGNLLNAASINGSVNSAPSACHKYLQHSMNFISAASPPALSNGSISLIDSPKPR